MSVELIGLIVFALAGIGVLHSLSFSFTVMAIAALLQAAAALYIGGAHVLPGHLAAGFFFGAVLIRQASLSNLIQATMYPRLGFFVMTLTVWALFTAFFVPRLFQGTFGVYPLTNPVEGSLLVEFPIGPNPSNFNQSLYAIVNFVTFVSVAAVARNGSLVRQLGFGLLIAAGVNLVLAMLDVATAMVGVEGLLSFIRNADYAQEFGQRFLGMKRISGSYPEPSAFAAMTVGIFAYALRLWRGGVYAPVSGWIALGTLIALLFSTSSTGYVALVVYLFSVYSLAIAGIDPARSSRREFRSRRAMFILFGPLAALAGLMVVAWRPDLLDPVANIFDSSIVNKLSSDSGIERMRWNMNALSNFVESSGIGAGLGTTRTSSFLVGVVGKLGVLGVIIYALIFLRLFRLSREQRSQQDKDWVVQQIYAAARSGCFGFIIGLGVSASTLDLGLLFFMMAGLACGNLAYQRTRLAPVVAHDHTA